MSHKLRIAGVAGLALVVGACASKAPAPATATITTTQALPALTASWVHLLVTEGAWRRPLDLARGADLLFGRRGFVRRILPRMGLFHRRDFHPDRRDTSALEAEWRERLFGEDGTLTRQVRHLPST